MASVCGTGHRPEKIGGYNEANPKAIWLKWTIKEVVRMFYSQGIDTFKSGGAVGFDQWLAEAVLELKKEGLPLTLIISRPFPSQDAVWSKETKERFRRICEAADVVEDVSPDPKKVWDEKRKRMVLNPKEVIPAMQKRNIHMVDTTDGVFALWDGSLGGTANCVRYALGKKPIFRLNPQTREVTVCDKSGQIIYTATFPETATGYVVLETKEYSGPFETLPLDGENFDFGWILQRPEVTEKRKAV